MKKIYLFKSILFLAFLSISLFAYGQTALGPAQISNQNTTDGGGFSSGTDVAMNSSDKYAIAWNRKIPSSSTLNGQSVFARIFNSNGSGATNDITVDSSNKSINDPQIGMDNSGNIYVIYDTKVSSSGTNYYLRVKKFNSSGNQVGSTLNLDQVDQSCKYDIDVKTNGQFVVFYTNTSNTTRLRLFSSSLSQIGSTNVSSGIKYYHHHVDVRGSKIAIGYSRTNDFKFRKYNISGSSLSSIVGTQTLPGGFCTDPIALRPNGQVAFLLSYGGSTKLHIRNSSGSVKSTSTISGANLNAGIDSDNTNRLYLAWANASSTSNGRIYSSTDNIIGTYNHQIPSFWRSSIAVYDCQFVTVGREEFGSWNNKTLRIWNRRFSCEDCSFDTNFTYTFACLGSTVQITATATTNYPSSLFQLYQPSSPSTSGNLGPALSTQFGNSVTFTVPNVTGAYYVIKHGNWSSNCPWQETRKLLYIPTFNYSVQSCFNYNISGGSNSSVTNIGLTPCANILTTNHWWFLQRSSSPNGPFTSVANQTSIGNGSVSFNNQAKGFYYRVYHYAKNDCSVWGWSTQVFYVNNLDDDPVGLLVDSGTDSGELLEFVDPVELLLEQGEVVIDEGAAVKLDSDQETTSTDKVTAEDVALYPTPTYDFVNLEFKKDVVVENIQVYNLNGQLIKTITTDQSRLVTMNVSDFVAGSYFIKLQTSDQIILKKFIKI